MFAPKTPRGQQEISAVKDNLIEISTKSDGFVIKKLSGSPLKNGDVLLVSYKTKGLDWTKTEIIFDDQPKGMFVFTGTKPTDIIVAVKRLVGSADSAADVPLTVYKPGKLFGGANRQSNLSDLHRDDSFNNNPFLSSYYPTGLDPLDFFRNIWHSIPEPSLPPRPEGEDPYSTSDQNLPEVEPKNSQNKEGTGIGEDTKGAFGPSKDESNPFGEKGDSLYGEGKEEAPFGVAEKEDPTTTDFGASPVDDRGSSNDSPGSSHIEPAAY